MKRTILHAAAAGLLVAMAGCAGGDATPSGTVRASISIAPATAAAIASASLNGIVADFMGGPVDPSMIDSLMVTVTRVDVLPVPLLGQCHPPVGDSASGFRPGRPLEHPMHDDDGEDEAHHDCRHLEGGMGPFGPGGPPGDGDDHEHPPLPDSLMPPDSGWGSRARHWFSLDVVGNGHIDLLHLPTGGLTLASGAVPAGDYRHARLIISDATIWFNTTVLTNDSVPLLPDTGYTVSLPHRRGGVMGIMTNSGFTIPDGGGNVQLLFDPEATIGHVIALDSGKVVMRPVLHPLH